MTTLREYLVQKRDAFRALQARPIDQVEPLQLKARTSAEGRSGIRRVRIRDFQRISDSPPDFAGYNLGPSSPEFQLGVLGSCLTHIFLIQAADKEIPLDALDVVVTSRPDANPPAGDAPPPRGPRNLHYTVYVDSPVSDAQLVELHAAVEAVCPVYNLLSNPQEITGRVALTPSTPEDIINPAQGLREYLPQKRAALLERRAHFEAEAQNPDRQPPAGLRAHVRAEGRSGIRRIRIRDFQSISDSPPDFAGYNLGPSSPENQLGVLSSCLTHVFLIQASDRQIPLDALEVEVTGKIDPRAGRPGFESVPRYPHEIDYTVYVRSPASPEAIEALHTAVKEVCPIYNLLKAPQTISGELVREAYQAAA